MYFLIAGTHLLQLLAMSMWVGGKDSFKEKTFKVARGQDCLQLLFSRFLPGTHFHIWHVRRRRSHLH